MCSRKKVIEIISEQLDDDDSDLARLRKRVDRLEGELESQKLFNRLLMRRVDDVEQYSRKQNLVFDGLNVKKGDGDEKIRGLVLAEIKRLKLDIREEEVVRAHRTGRPFVDRNGRSHVPVICRFASWRPRNVVWDARHDSRLYVKPDLTARRANLLQDARERISESDSLASTLCDYAYADRNCQLSIRTKDKRFLLFNSMEEFDGLLAYIVDTCPPYAAVFKLMRDDDVTFQREVAAAVAAAVVPPVPVQLFNLAPEAVAEWVKDPTHVYIGAALDGVDASPWANPFMEEEHGTEAATTMYREKVMNTPSLDLATLRGKTLGCACSDENCHGQVLKNLIIGLD